MVEAIIGHGRQARHSCEQGQGVQRAGGSFGES